MKIVIWILIVLGCAWLLWMAWVTYSYKAPAVDTDTVGDTPTQVAVEPTSTPYYGKD